jgi:hypothetical protein
MKPFAELAALYFDFLTVRHGFSRAIISPTQVSYKSDRVFFEISHNPRDGISVTYGRLSQHGASSTRAVERLCLVVYLGAIHTYLGNFKEYSESVVSLPDYTSRKLADLAVGLTEFGRGLITGEAALYEKAHELRFWHVGHWTEQWGTGIVMSEDEIVRQRHLVPQILSIVRESK